MNLLFQTGDLPEEVQAGQLDNTIPDLALKLGGTPDEAASLTFKVQGGNEADYGNVMLLYYHDPGLLNKASQWLIQSEQARRQGAPQAGIGDIALLFLPEQPGRDTALLFQVCHSFVEIRLLTIDDPAIILRYAGRLAERLQWLDCQGHSTIPILTPPPSVLTPTGTLPIPITQGYTQVQRLPDPDGATSIRAYAFADQQHGWLALGASILATSDGGKTWQFQTSTDGKVEQIRFESAQIGWILTEKGFLVTQDGGGSWQKSDSQPASTHASMPPPVTTLLPPDQLESFAFCPREAPFAGVFTSIDARTGWAFCTSHPMDHFNMVKLFQTRDGGQHWQLLLDQAPYGRYGASNLFFLDGQHGWLAVQAEGGASLYATTDGGRTWQPVSIDQIGIPENARSVTFLSPQAGFVILSNSPHNQGREVLMGTLDGGKTWQELFDAPAPSPWPSGPFHIFADGHGIGFERGENVAVLADTLLTTMDWGKSWTPSGSSIRVLGCSDHYVSITSLSFPDQAHGWATLACASSPSSLILHTENWGQTWSEASAPVNSSSGFVGVSFPDGSTGYLVSQAGILYRTTDAGRSFSPVDQQALHTRSLQFVTPLMGWEVRGVDLFETRDGGLSWRPVPFPLPVQYFALLPNHAAWVVAGQTTSDNGAPIRRLFTTTDDGGTWTELPFAEIPSNFDFPWLDGLQFADNLHGWLRGDTSLFFTQVGGKTWTQIH